jgi:hypothetical protein
MTDRNRATTLRLRTPATPPSPDALAPRSFVGAGSRSGGAEVRRPQVQTFVTRRADPTSKAILDELAALGLAETDEGE